MFDLMLIYGELVKVRLWFSSGVAREITKKMVSSLPMLITFPGLWALFSFNLLSKINTTFIINRFYTVI